MLLGGAGLPLASWPTIRALTRSASQARRGMARLPFAAVLGTECFLSLRLGTAAGPRMQGFTSRHSSQ